MTADALRSRVIARLIETRATTVGNLRRCRPRAPTQMQGGAVINAATAEEIALYAVDLNATIDALDNAINIIQDEFKKLMSPEQPDDDEKPGKEARQLYG